MFMLFLLILHLGPQISTYPLITFNASVWRRGRIIYCSLANRRRRQGHPVPGSRDSAVGITTGYGLDD
jgi:hypothetical protein